jgi:hypothetical protein
VNGEKSWSSSKLLGVAAAMEKGKDDWSLPVYQEKACMSSL